MKITSYGSAEQFLGVVGGALERNEVANGLMLGVCSRLVEQPERFSAQACLLTASDENGLALAAMMTPPHKLVPYAHQDNLDRSVPALVKELVRQGWCVPGVLGPSQAATAFAKVWGREKQVEVRLDGRQRIYKLTEVVETRPARGRLPALRRAPRCRRIHAEFDVLSKTFSTSVFLPFL